MLNTVKLKETLLKYWGHVSFRPLQERIITDVINRKDTLAILPTGGGKSICYQLPAIVQEGTCIVISPLTALINDQIQNLKQKGIEALTIPSNSNIDDIIRIFDNIRLKKIKLLYLSPERLAQPIIQDKIKQLLVSFIAIDEAHCISQWGHDFRPSYIKVGEIRNLLPNKNILAVTATATKKTQNQIINLLKLKDVDKHIGSFNRSNLAYQIFETPNKIDLLYKILQKQNSPTIIYLQSRLAVQELSKQLNNTGLKSTYYHAGLNRSEKEKNFNLWNTEQQNIMIATNAFGMGIDKNNVRLVIHLELPNTLENYLQEAGRAGRDEKKSFSCVILTHHDFVKFQQKNQSIITADTVLDIYKKLNQHFQIALGETPEDIFDFDIQHFCSKYKLNISITEKTLRRLDNYGIIYFKEQQHNSSLLKVNTSRSQIVQFANQHIDYGTLMDYILRNYTGIFDIDKKLNLTKISNATGLNIQTIHKKLNYLHQLDLVVYKPQEKNHTLQFLMPREDKKTINPIKKELNELCNIDIEKSRRSLAYFKNESQCRNSIILNYFEEKSTNPCGICDICIANNKLNEMDALCKQTLTILKAKSFTFNDLLIALKVNSITLKKVIQHLFNEECIIQKQQFFQINE